MAISYQFIKNDVPQELNDVDRELCEEFGHKYNDAHYCEQFQTLRMVGIAVLIRASECYTNEELVEKYLNETKTGFTPDEKQFIREFFGRYTFRAWR